MYRSSYAQAGGGIVRCLRLPRCPKADYEREKSDDAKSSALRIAPPDPKSGASANFATLAAELYILDFRFQTAPAAISALNSTLDVGRLPRRSVAKAG